MSDNREQRGAVSSFYLDVTGGFEQEIFLTSDVHIDSIYCNREMFFADMDEAKRRNAMIFIFGDLFDAMQGRFDNRRSMAELRPEYRRDDYYDYVVQDVAAMLAPYADNIGMMSKGNHETAVLKNANTDLMDGLIRELRYRTGANILRGGYGGYVRFMFKFGSGEDDRANPHSRASVKIKYFHGSGGEAPVTRGAIQTNRQAVYIPDAQIVVNGHSHNAYVIPITRERLSDKGEIFFDTAYHVRTPGYKQSYGDGSRGWDVERGGVPKPIGGCWVKMRATVEARRYIRLNVQQEIHNPEPVDPTDAVYDGPVYGQDGADDL